MVHKLLVLTEINSSLQMDQFMYTESKISSHSGHFGPKVKRLYSAQDGDKCWCLLTDDVLPSSTVIGAHLFKHGWKEQIHIIGIDNIDDTRNGLPLWKPIEWAYDTSRYVKVPPSKFVIVFKNTGAKHIKHRFNDVLHLLLEIN